ncbi:HK97 gp10 family phage protein [Polycladomyces sp. WAk]|uniref:HK97 gp10 family phage protein n=1 Tax=Polycladomyces zharkentensis TaxID=2807616 RepID=A0ABS2WI50_9BACL|nr:HK97-gp10 family putative phage morphogenesis protein [Polycladomyces sp. WAk]MBN2909156.1 HK97 gp10 family phage protein [Polycladomyces sp. WAk]
MTDIDWSGVEEMLLNIQRLGQKVSRRENQALRAGAKELQETMARNAPGPSYKKRVHLKDNIQMSNVKRKEYGKAIEVGPGKTSFYARFLEFGTSKMSPHPFVGPSIVESRERVLKAMADELRRGMGLG